MGIKSDRVFEFFTVTAWGQVPTMDDLLRDIPNVSREHSRLDALNARLNRWRGQA
jgi:hypothetical protein